MMKSLVSRIKAFALLLAVAAYGGAWAENYTFSNVDSNSLASWSDPSYGTQSFQFKLNAPSAKLAVGNFPSSGYVQLTSISLSARSDQSGYTGATKAILTNDKTSESYTATVAYNDNAFSASMNPSLISDSTRREWTRMEVLMTFSTDGVLVDTDATYTLTFKNASDANVTMGYSVVKNDSLSIGWTPAMRIYGRTPSGSMEMPSSLIPSTGGITLPSTVIVADATDIAFASDSVTVGNGGISVSTSTRPVTVMMKVDNVPSTQSILTAVVLANNRGMTLTRTTTGFQQGESNNGSLGTNNGSGWGAASTTTVAAGTHWITLTYEHTANGTHSYMDGSSVACSTAANGLRYSGSAVTTVAIGGPTATVANYPAAVGMVIKDVQIYSTELTTAQVATVTAALNKGWTVNASGTTITSATLRELPNHANVQAIGSLAIATDGTYTASGLTEVKVLAGGSFDIGTARPTISGVASTGSLAVAPTGTVSKQIEGYVATEYLTVTGDLHGTVTLGGNTVTPVVADGTATLTSTLSANPTYTGESWWWDYEFNGTVVSIGSDTGGMTQEGSGTSFYNNSELYFQKTPYRGASFSDKSELTAVMYCQPGNYANAVLVGFGSTTQGDQKAIALVTGANPSAGEMKLVLTDGHNGGTGTVTELADLTAVGATTTKHLYAFVMDRISENKTTKTRIRVYLDGKVKAIYKHNGTLTLSNGFQIGSLHGGIYPRDGFNTGLSKYSATGDSGTLDFLRVIDGTLTDGAMAALAAAYPYNSTHGEATRAPVSSAANWVSDGAWTQKVPGTADETKNKPNDDTNVKLSIADGEGTGPVPVAINLTSDSNYESLTLGKEVGTTRSLKLTSTYGSGSGKLKSAETSVLVNTKIPAGRVNLGITSIADGVTLTVDPYSNDNNTTGILYGLTFGEVYEDVIISMALLGNGASVELDNTNLATLSSAGFTAELVYTESNQSYAFKVTRQPATTQEVSVTVNAGGDAEWMTGYVPLAAPDTLPDTYSGTVTINCVAESPGTTIDTTFNGGKVRISNTSPSSPAINFTGRRVVFDVQSGETLYLNGKVKTRGGDIVFTGGGTVVCSAADTLQGTVKGCATIQYTGVLPVVEDSGDTYGANFTHSDWTGTNKLINCQFYTGATRQRAPFERYGNENSFIKAPGFIGYAADTEEDTICQAELIIDEGETFEFNHGWRGTDADVYQESENANFKFRKLSGSGTLRLDGTTDYAQYIFRDVSDFTGNMEITFPGSGGRKSYLFGEPEGYKTIGSAYPANLVIMSNVTTPEGKVWTIPAGVIISEDATLTLGAGSTITALSPFSSGTLKVESGTAYVAGVTNSIVKADLDIAGSATLCISNTTMTALTIPADAGVTYKNSGMLDLSECTALTKLYLELGASKTFDFNKVKLPSACTDVYYYVGDARNMSEYGKTGSFSGRINYIATETVNEFASGNFTMNNVPSGAEVWVIRKTGATVQATPPSEGSNQRTYSQGSVFSGTACWHEWDFELTTGDTGIENKLDDTGKFSTLGTGTITLAKDRDLTVGDYSSWELANGEPAKCAISSAVHPRASCGTFGGDSEGNWSAAVRCTMPSDDGKHVAVTFGDTDSGILGLAYDNTSDVVELFKWNNADSPKYTTLANLQVERATVAMHIYAVAVTNDTTAAKKYLSFYRDGEFIHKMELTSPTTITNFMVGGVVVGTAERTELPADASSGWVDYVRLYDKTLDAAIAEGLSARRPFVSQYETYVREVAGNAVWVSPNSWASKTNDTVMVASPGEHTHVTLLANGLAGMSVNLQEDASYSTLIVAPAAGAPADTWIEIGSNGEGEIGAEMIVVRTAVTVEYGAVKFSDAMVGVDQGASLTFNFKDFPFEDVTESTNVYVTGRVVARQYDESVDDRIKVTGKPRDTWTVVDPTYESSSGRYYVTIELDHAPGSDVYYAGGYWSSAESSFAVTNASGKATTVFEGDTVVIPAYISGARASNAYFGSSLPDNVSKIRVEKNNYTFEPGIDTAIFDGAEIEVASGCTLKFGATSHALKLGDVKLAGNVEFTKNAEAASITGNPAITINNVTLTLDEPSSEFAGSFSGTGTVKFKSVTGEGFDVSHYMPNYGTLAIASMNNYFKKTGDNTVNVSSSLRLDGPVEISGLSGDWTYTFAKLTGTGNFTIPNSSCQSFTITKIEDYTGSLNAGRAVTVSRIDLASEPKAGDLLLATNSTGTVTVSAVYVGGVRANWPVVFAEGGAYKPAATYNGTPYIDIADAIAAAEAAGAGLDTISVWDTTVTLPVGYEISGGLVAKAASIFVWTGGGESTSWTEMANWGIGVATPARLPASVDTVYFPAQATVVLPVSIAVNAVTCDMAVTLNNDSANVTLTAPTVLATRDASITLGDGVSLSVAPTTTVADGTVMHIANNYSVVIKSSSENADGTKTVEITPPEGVTSIDVEQFEVDVGDTVVIPATVTQVIGTIDENNLILKVSYNEGSDSAYYSNILKLEEGIVSLNADESVTVGGKPISVKPEVDAGTEAPMSVSGAAPTFNVKTIPGLWYVVYSGTAPGSLVAGTAEADQATDTRKSLVGVSLEESEVVKYYRISVGLTKDDAEGK